MLIETPLLLGTCGPKARELKPIGASQFAKRAALAEDIGFDSVVVDNSRTDPFGLLSLGASSTDTIELGATTSLGSLQSPTKAASSAWAIQANSDGRFVLSVGAKLSAGIQQIRNLSWRQPGPWLRDYVLAIRAVWSSWQDETDIHFTSDHYRLSLNIPGLNPEPIQHPDIPIYVSVSSPELCVIAGEVADGIRLDPTCTPTYIDNVVKPALSLGAAKSGRDPDAIKICVRPLAATASTSSELSGLTELMRSRVAYYLSNPANRHTFEAHGWSSVAKKASGRARSNQWDAVTSLVTDQMLHTVATIGTYDTIASQLHERYGQCADRMEYSLAIDNDEDSEVLRSMVLELSA